MNIGNSVLEDFLQNSLTGGFCLPNNIESSQSVQVSLCSIAVSLISRGADNVKLAPVSRLNFSLVDVIRHPTWGVPRSAYSICSMQRYCTRTRMPRNPGNCPISSFGVALSFWNCRNNIAVSVRFHESTSYSGVMSWSLRR